MKQRSISSPVETIPALDCSVLNSIFLRFQGASKADRGRRYNYYHFFLFEQGKGIHTIDNTDFHITGSQFHVLYPGQVHHWDAEESTVGYRLAIPEHIYDTFPLSCKFALSRLREHPVVSLTSCVFQKVLAEFHSIWNDLYAVAPIAWEVINTRIRLIALMVIHDLSVTRPSPQSVPHPLLVDLYTLVESHFRDHKPVSFYARELNVSPGYLGLLCKKELDATPMQLIQQRVSTEAKKMMQTAGKSIKEVAFALGFNDLAHFSRFFKSQTGSSPRQFKSQSHGTGAEA